MNISANIWLFITVLALRSNCIFGQNSREFVKGLQYLEKHQLTAQILAPRVQYEAGILEPISFSTSFSLASASVALLQT